MDKLRVGIIGAGVRGIATFGKEFTDHFAEQVAIVALADPNLERARAGLAWLKVKADVHPEPDDLLSRKDVDAVVITSPDYLHERHAVLAFKHGKHVLIDKPLAITVDGCLNVVEASRRAGKLLYMGFNLRHHPMVRQIREMVASGVLGEIFSIQAIEHYKGGRTYHARWNRLKEFTGGLWIHKGSHDFDVLNNLMAPAKPVRVACFATVSAFRPDRLPFAVRESVPVGPTCAQCGYNQECPDVARYDNRTDDTPYGGMFGAAAAAVDGYYKDLCMYTSNKDTHDQGIAIVEFSNGATASHSEYFATPLSMRRYLLEGIKGHAESDADERVTFTPRWGGEPTHYPKAVAEGGHGGADPQMIREFVACLRGGQRPTASGVDGTWSVAVAVAAERARTEKRVVSISELMDPGSDLLRPEAAVDSGAMRGL